MNDFYKDCQTLFKDISKNIATKAIVSEMEVIQNTLYFALGIEKLLKGMLYEINPILILENSDFKNSFPLYYREKLIAENEKSKDINQEPNGEIGRAHV